VADPLNDSPWLTLEPLHAYPAIGRVMSVPRLSK
jgi:hypothetical protein